MTEEKLEKVINGLEHELQNRGKCGHYCRDGIETVSCEYDKDGLCIQHWGNDALALLKAQKPRIMAEAEIRESDFCYLEVYGCSYITPVLLRNESEKRIGVTCDSGSFYWFDMDCDLGKLVRCWTSRPTDEQREAIPWEMK